MGLAIERTSFTPRDRAHFRQRLGEQLRALQALLRRPGFGSGPASLGAELELQLVDADLQPAPKNIQVLETADDPRVTLELNRFNLELNARPLPLAGPSMGGLHEELRGGLSHLQAAAREHGCQLVAVGILPTLRADQLGPDARTDTPRFNALSDGLRALRGEAFEVHVDGADPLHLRCDGVTFEGANTALQIHLRVAPDAFARVYNAVQLSAAPLLAVAGNSPFFVGHRLWEETRIALFKHAVDARTRRGDGWHAPPRVCFGHGWLRDGALELFREGVALHSPLLPVTGEEDALAVVEAGGVPRLDELRLHHSTVWSWNRAVYDPASGGHLRVELRTLPAGPSLVDMVANAAFALGLALALSEEDPEWLCRFPFEYARYNLYRAAQHGLSAELLWPARRAPSPRPIRASELASALLPRAAEGLSRAGVQDGAAYLDVIEARLRTGRTGARYQRETYEALRRRHPPQRALREVLARYQAQAEIDAPVHEW